MNYNNVIKKSYFINMDKSKDRRTIFEYQVKQLGIENVERYEAMNMLDYLAENNPILLANSKKELLPAYGLTISNYEIYKMVLLDDTISDNDYICIYEDDCVFLSNFEYLFDILIKQLDSDFDILNLGGLIQPTESKKNIAVTPNLIKVNTPGLFMAQSVIYRKGAIYKIVDIIDRLLESINDKQEIYYEIIIDHILSNNYQNFDSYVCYPPITYQLNDMSLIQDDKFKFLDLKLKQKRMIKNKKILDKMHVNLKKECNINNFKFLF